MNSSGMRRNPMSAIWLALCPLGNIRHHYIVTAVPLKQLINQSLNNYKKIFRMWAIQGGNEHHGPDR